MQQRSHHEVEHPSSDDPASDDPTSDEVPAHVVGFTSTKYVPSPANIAMGSHQSAVVSAAFIARVSGVHCMHNAVVRGRRTTRRKRAGGQ